MLLRINQFQRNVLHLQVLQRRRNKKVGFNRYWKEYQYGFGDISGNHWIGMCLTLSVKFTKPRLPENDKILYD